MEALSPSEMFSGVYSGRRVMVTGHTGFKGSWLCAWLLELGADVAGFSNGIPTTPSHFEILGLRKKLRHFTGDVRNLEQLKKAFRSFRPDMVFHLAAQSLVRRSYQDPNETFAVNAMGTANVLECIRLSPSVGAVVIVTSDKCYRNVEWNWGYRENDALGGEDPYSGSKGCAELIFRSYSRSFFGPGKRAVRAATARAGNVIGGGDWAQDRIVPDCVRSWSKNRSVFLRNPRSTRPWQHVLEPLSGYLWLGSRLWKSAGPATGSSYNFGPDASVNQSVESLVREVARSWPGAKWRAEKSESRAKPEAALLKLNCDKALAELKWRATLSFDETARMTGEWYRHYYEGERGKAFDLTMAHIGGYCRRVKEKSLPWSWA